jgi:diguanylate cyclase (GGDEF)-like protein/PAS domain S-box-containing protein
MKSVSVLLVETNPVTRKTLKLALDAEGYTVTEVRDATAALESAKRRLPDIVLQDLILPDFEGYELARELRALPGATELPIIALSSNADSWDKDWASLFSDSLTEPIEPSAVLESIETILASRRSRRPEAPRDAARSNAVLGMVNTFLRRVCDTGSHPLDSEQLLGELLSSYLEACGFGLGAAFLADASKHLRLGAQCGDSPWLDRIGSDFFGHERWLSTVLESNEPVGWTTRMTPMPSIADIAATAGIRSMLVVPVHLDGGAAGVVVLASRKPDLPSNWEVMARALQGAVAPTLALAQTVAKLVISDQRFRGIPDTNGEGIIASDLTGRILYADPAAERMLGTTSAALTGASVRQFCPTLKVFVGVQQALGVRGNGEQFPLEIHTHAREGGDQGAYFLHVVRDVTHRHAFAGTTLAADQDPLTELSNRRRFEEELRRRLNEARRYGDHGAVLLFDIDKLKNLNDTLGPSAGDAALRRVARVLGRVTRDSDFLARLGGDDFAVLLPRSDEAGARRCAQRILNELANPEKLASGHRAASIAGSIGFALFPAHAAEPESILQCAEHALHQAKYADGDHVALFEPGAGRTPVQSAARLRNADEAAATQAHAQGEE